MADIPVLMDALIDKRARYALGKAPATPALTLRLFVNNRLPTQGDSPGDYVECSLAGYGPAALTPASWSGTTVSGRADYIYPPITFTLLAGGQTIFGHYVTDSTDGSVAWAELWDTPFVVPGMGATLTVTLEWLDEQCPSIP